MSLILREANGPVIKYGESGWGGGGGLQHVIGGEVGG